MNAEVLQFCHQRECWSSVTTAPLLTLSLRRTVERVVGACVSGTSSQRLTFSHIGVMSCVCRSRRKVFNLSRLCLLAEGFPLAAELILHCKCQA